MNLMINYRFHNNMINVWKTIFPEQIFAFKIRSRQFLYQMVLCVIINLLVDIQLCKLITQTASFHKHLLYREVKQPCEHSSTGSLWLDYIYRFSCS
jgi:hypothetical protein